MWLVYLSTPSTHPGNTSTQFVSHSIFYACVYPTFLFYQNNNDKHNINNKRNNC